MVHLNAPGNIKKLLAFLFFRRAYDGDIGLKLVKYYVMLSYFRNISLSENFAYVLNKWSLKDHPRKKFIRKLDEFKWISFTRLIYKWKLEKILQHI